MASCNSLALNLYFDLISAFVSSIAYQVIRSGQYITIISCNEAAKKQFPAIVSKVC